MMIEELHTGDASMTNMKDSAEFKPLSLAEVTQYPVLLCAGDNFAAPIAELIAPVLYNMGYALVRAKFQGDANLQIMIGRLDETAIGTADCTAVSRHLSAVFDVEEVIETHYVLEISSAGLDCPLTRHRDFTYYMGFDVKIEMQDTSLGFGKIRGVIQNVEGENIIVTKRGASADEQQEFTLPINALRMAKLVLTDELLKNA